MIRGKGIIVAASRLDGPLPIDSPADLVPLFLVVLARSCLDTADALWQCGHEIDDIFAQNEVNAKEFFHVIYVERRIDLF
jgi:hypothetical protein